MDPTEIKIRLAAAELPETISGAIKQIASNSYLILTNSNKSKTEQAAAFLHEALHIFNDDLAADASADNVERRTDRQLKEIANLWLQQQQ